MGPTASGKTALALALAERAGGEIVNADAMQVYRDLRVLTARPTPEDEARAPHHLFGHVDPASRYSVARWLAEAAPCIEDIQARGRTPIVVGGTGLYFKALTEGLADAPEAPEVRARLAARLAADGPQSLYAALAQVDPAAASALSPRDGARILRALEVWETTGASILAMRERTRPALAAESWIGAALRPERSAVYAAITARFAAMVQDGALEEARALMARGLDPAASAMKAIGVGPLMAHLRGEISLERARERSERDTRRYAKRQYTWIAGQMRRWPRIESAALQNRLEDVFALIRGVDPAFATI
ncbi:MAG: tRNA (adenosine(37)-N6)-dimethylallyltransferase MiaA [Hyphomonadaceae bacterium]